MWWAAKQMVPPFVTSTQGPIRALAAALCHIGWLHNGPTTMTSATGITMDLTAGTPTMLNKYLIEDYKKLVDDKITEHLRNREVCHPNLELDWYTIRKFLLH